MTPSETSPLRLSMFHTQSPIGLIVAFEDDAGFVRALNFQERIENAVQLLRRYYGEVELSDGRSRSPALDLIDAYFTGNLSALSKMPFTLPGTDFQRSVWLALCRIKPGTTASYAAVANMIGRPGTARAVGAAIAANPIALVVPCHRIIGSDLTLTGYGPGLYRKRWLFAHEVAHRNSSHAFEDVRAFKRQTTAAPTLEKSGRRSLLRALGDFLHFNERSRKYVADLAGP